MITAHKLYVRTVDVPDGKQPDQLTAEEIQEPVAKA